MPRPPFRVFNLACSFLYFFRSFFTLLLCRSPFQVFNLYFFLAKPKKGNNIIYNHFRRGVYRLRPQTWYFFNWSMLVGLVKGFASKSINLTAPLEYIYLIIYRPTQFFLNFLFVSWIKTLISFSTKSPNFRSLVLTFLSKAFLSLLC